MSAVKRAVQSLNHSVSRLEAAAQKQSQKIVQLRAMPPQTDLFAAAAAPSSLLARKLDLAIEKVEQLLQEA